MENRKASQMIGAENSNIYHVPTARRFVDSIAAAFAQVSAERKAKVDEDRGLATTTST